MAPQVTINFNELPITIVVKRVMFTTRRNAQMVFTIGPRSILTEFLLSNSMEPLRGLKRANRPALMTDNEKVGQKLKAQQAQKRQVLR